MGAVDRALWPLLMAAAEIEAEANNDNSVLSSVLGRAAHGVGQWRDALSRGRLWLEEEGADWPAAPVLRRQWTELLQDLEMPRFTRRYPRLVQPLLASLLEAVQRFSAPEEQQQEEPQLPEGDGLQKQGEGGEESEGAGEDGDGLDPEGADARSAKEASEAGEGDQGMRQDEEAKAAELMQSMREQWQGTAKALQEAEEVFGEAGGSAVADGVGEGGDTPWQETGTWKEISKLRTLLNNNPEVRELVRNLGRRSAVKGPLRRLPEEVERAVRPLGVVRSRTAPAEASGVCLAGEWDTMLPSEAQLLASKQPMLRTLHHARRIERSLLSYDRVAWMEEHAQETGRMELRPSGKAGPLIVCLDTSGSMQGQRETLGKALVLESLRQAHRQRRRCYLYAFSGTGQLQELELSLSTQGLKELLQFLRFSFCGGTSLDAALEASTERLAMNDGWHNADILIVTDGELPRPADNVVSELDTACCKCGTRIVGLVLGDETGTVMEELCTELYTTGQPELPFSSRAALQHLGKGKPWPQLRQVEAVNRAPARLATSASGQLRSSTSRVRGRTQGGSAHRAWGASAHCAASGLVARAGLLRRQPAALLTQLQARATPASQRPDINRFSESLLKVIQKSETEARRLGHVNLDTESLLLGLLAAPAASTLMRAVFPDGKASVQAARALAEEKLAAGGSGKRSRGKAAAPLPFTPMAQRALFRAQQEQERHGESHVEPAHLLLGLLQDKRGDACEMLTSLQASVETVRVRVLGTLSDPLATVRLIAAEQLAEIRRAVESDVAPAEQRRLGVTEEEAALTQRLVQALATLTEDLVERSVEAKLLLLAALSGEHLFLLGPPGTAKSLLARRLSQVCEGSFFERLLTRFSVPEEVFGPLSLKALENDELRRKIEGFLPDADVAFLDEVFKANSSILNALLALLNERVYDNGGSRMKVPLWCAVAASNELPESEELDALFDRFLLRRSVPRVSDEAVPGFLRTALDSSAVSEAAEAQHGQSCAGPALTAADSAEAQRGAAVSVSFPERLLKLVAGLRAHLRDESEPPVLLSDRRLAKAVRLLRVAVHAVGGTEVSELDLLLLQHVFWDREPEQATAVRSWLFDQFVGPEPDDCIPQVRFVLNGVRLRLRRSSDPKAAAAAARDLQSLQEPLEDRLRARLAREEELHGLLFEPEAADGSTLRNFWLESSDLEEARERMLPQIQKGVADAEAVLLEVLELLAALAQPGAKEREVCVKGLLESESVSQGGETGTGMSQEQLNKWAAQYELPADPSQLMGRGF